MNEKPRINIDELYETKQKKDLMRLSVYNKLLEKIHYKIKIASRQKYNNEFCPFVMPEVLIGYPNYNFQECLLYIIDCLKDDGFLTNYIHPNLLLISWRHCMPHYVRDEYKKKTGISIDKFGNEIIDKNKLELSKEPKIMNKLKNHNKSNYKLNDKVNDKTIYKPSGKFIYDSSILNKINEIL